MDEGAGLGAVIAPRFPLPKTEGWWLLVGDSKKNRLYGLKRVTLGRAATVAVPFEAPEDVGPHGLDLLLMSDAYLGCDKQLSLSLVVVPDE